MRLKPVIRLLSLVALIIIHEAESSGVLPGSVKACKIKKLLVRVTRIIFTLYGDTSEPPITEVIVNYYDPKSKKAKQLGKTNQNSNGRSIWPLWNEEDGTLVTDENPGLM